MLKERILGLACVGLCVFIAAGCDKKQSGADTSSGLKPAALLVELPDYCNTPDAMALLPDGSFENGLLDDEIAKWLHKLGKKARHITGFSNRMNYFILTRLLPRKLASRMANRVMKKMYTHE